MRDNKAMGKIRTTNNLNTIALTKTMGLTLTRGQPLFPMVVAAVLLCDHIEAI